MNIYGVMQYITDVSRLTSKIDCRMRPLSRNILIPKRFTESSEIIRGYKLSLVLFGIKVPYRYLVHYFDILKESDKVIQIE